MPVPYRYMSHPGSNGKRPARAADSDAAASLSSPDGVCDLQPRSAKRARTDVTDSQLAREMQDEEDALFARSYHGAHAASPSASSGASAHGCGPSARSEVQTFKPFPSVAEFIPR